MVPSPLRRKKEVYLKLQANTAKESSFPKLYRQDDDDKDGDCAPITEVPTKKLPPPPKPIDQSSPPGARGVQRRIIGACRTASLLDTNMGRLLMMV